MVAAWMLASWYLAQEEQNTILPPAFTELATLFGVPGTLLTVFMMVMTDMLVPGRRVAKIEQDLHYWRELAKELMKQNAELMITGRVVTAAFARSAATDPEEG